MDGRGKHYVKQNNPGKERHVTEFHS
jgi:hypothetical protein